MASSSSRPAQRSGPGPIRSTPRNKTLSDIAKANSSPMLNNNTARAISNARREAAALGITKTRKGWLESIAGYLRPVKQTISNALFRETPQTPSDSLWKYIKTTTMSYLGFQPPRKLQSMLDERLWIEHRQREQEEREKRARELEASREAEERRQAQLAAQVQELGKSLETIAENQPVDMGKQWVQELSAGLHPRSKLAANVAPTKKSSKKVREEKENSASLANLMTPRPTQPTMFLKKPQQNFKDQFQANFKSDPSKDQEKLEFLQKFTGWSLNRIRHQFKIYQRFPNLENNYDFKKNNTADIVKLAEILCDRGFLKRQHISTRLTFEPIWGRTTYDDEQHTKNMPKVYVPKGQLEPEVSYRPREFSMPERVKMMEETCYEPVRSEWRKQTIYDLEFVTPSDPRLAIYEKEIFDVDFEVSRDDPRIRHLWSLAPSVRVYRPDVEKNTTAYTRLCYKQLLANRDYWYWQLTQEIENRDRALAKVFRHFDLNRKRSEMKWNEYQRVYLVQKDASPEPEEVEETVAEEFISQEPIIVEEYDLVIEDEEEEPISDDELAQRALPDFTISRTYLPNATAKTREQYGPMKRLPAQKRKRPSTPYRKASGVSAKAWANPEADLSDEDNFPSRPPQAARNTYPMSGAEYQGSRLAKAFGSDEKSSSFAAYKKLHAQKKKVTFAQGHTETIFRPYEEESPTPSRSVSPEDMRAAKKLKASDGGSINRAPSALRGVKKPAVPVQNLHGASSPNGKVPRTLTRPAQIGEGSSNPLKRSYQASLAELPREWRSKPGCFSAWDEDAQDAGVFYEIDIEDGKLPKGVGTWEIELDQTRGPKRIRVMRQNGSEQDFAVWDLDGKLQPLDWAPADVEDDSSEVSEPPAKKAQKSTSGQVKPLVEQKGEPSMDKGKGKSVTFEESPKEKVPQPKSDFQITYDAYLKEYEKEQKKEAEERAQTEQKTSESSAASGSIESNTLSTPKPRKLRRSASEMRSIDIDPSFPIFNPFVTESPGAKAGLSQPSSKTNNPLPSPPLSGDDENSGKEDVLPGSKAKARLTGLFDPVQSQKTPFTVVEDTTAHESKAAEKPAESFQSDTTAPSSQESEAEASNVLKPVVNDATLPRQGSSSDVPKAQSLLPSAPIMSTTPATPSAAITAAEIGMFGAVKPSPSEKRGLDEDSGMDIDNTPLSAKRTRSPKEFGLVTNASTSMVESFKPVIPTSFDFGGMSSKPLFGAANNAVVANASAPTSAPFLFGAPATSKPADEPFKFGAGTSNTTSGSMNDLFQFGGASTAAPSIFGATATEKPAEAPFVFGANKPAEKPTDATFLFGASKPAEKPADAPFVFGGKATATPVSSGIFGAPATAAPSIFGESTAGPSALFGTSTAAAPSIFGASTSAPSTNMFGATSTNPPTSNGLFGAVSGVTAAPSFGSAPATQSFNFGAPATSAPSFGGNNNNTATSSASFTFGSTATSQPMQFGAELNKPTAASFTSGFTFGSGAGAESPAPNGMFGFGATSNAPSPAPTGPTAPPMFGASNPGTPTPQAAGGSFGGGDMFGFQPQQTNTFGRTIKTAVSRKAGSVRGRR